MKLVNFLKENSSRVGIIYENHVIDIKYIIMTELAKEKLTLNIDIPNFISNKSHQKHVINFIKKLETLDQKISEIPKDSIYELKELHFLPPVLKPTKVIGVGLNYYSFINGTGDKAPSYPELFHKTSSSLTGNNQPILIPDVTQMVVPEGELAVIIGKSGKYISESSALSYIGGYCCANDVNARDLEFRGTQWTSGKMLETFCPLGPFLITPDEVKNPNNLKIETYLNGNIIQSGNTNDMIFNIQSLISQISSVVTLELGDVILTGTSSDLGVGNSPVTLKKGDVVEVLIEGIGRLKNPVSNFNNITKTI